VGLKENVILGHLIPAGTGFRPHMNMRVRHLAEPVPERELAPAEAHARMQEAASAAAELAVAMVPAGPGLPPDSLAPIEQQRDRQ